MCKVHAEIEYDNVHSDLCPRKCSCENITDPLYKELLHQFLDEWLENSKGSGGFYIKAESHQFDFQTADPDED